MAVVRLARADECLGVFRDVQPAVDHGFVLGFRTQLQGEQKFPDDPAHVGKSVRIAIEVAQHHVVLGVQVSVTAVFGKDQRVQKEFVFRLAAIAEQRPAHARQGLLLDLAQDAEQLLSGLAQDDFLGHLKTGDALAILQRLLLAHAFVTLEHHAAAFQHLRKL